MVFGCVCTELHCVDVCVTLHSDARLLASKADDSTVVDGVSPEHNVAADQMILPGIFNLAVYYLVAGVFILHYCYSRILLG